MKHFFLISFFNFLVLFCSASWAEILFSQPNTVTDVASIALVNKVPPRGKLGVILWGSNYPLYETGDITLNNYTGFLPPSPLSKYQMSVSPKWPGATAIQAFQGEIGMNIHSASIPLNLNERYNLGTIVMHYDFPVPVLAFSESANRLLYSFRIEVPRAYQTGQGVSQVVAYFYFLDKTTKQGFWYGFSTFDSRGIGYQFSQGVDRVMWDQGTGTPIVQTTAGYSVQLAENAYSPNRFMGTTYTGLRRYVFAVSAVQMSNAIKMLKSRYPALASRLSDLPSNYLLTHINLNPEIKSPPGSFAHIGVSVRELQVELQH